MEPTEGEYTAAVHALAESQYEEFRRANNGMTFNPQTRVLSVIAPWSELPRMQQRPMLEAALEVVQVVTDAMPDRRELALQEFAVAVDKLPVFEHDDGHDYVSREELKSALLELAGSEPQQEASDGT